MSGFVRAANGKMKSFDPQGSAATEAYAINDKGEITGFWDNGQVRGYVRSARGQFVLFDPSDSVDSEPYGINDKNAVTGYFTDGSGYTHGFIRAP